VYGGGDEGKAAFTEDAYGKYARTRAKAPGTLASLDAMAAQAERLWGGGKPYFVRVWHPGDANSYVELRRSYARDVTMNLDQIYFDAATGAVLKRFEATPVMTAQRFISGIHFVQFEHWPLRWLYFAGGLTGCVLIATGFLFWLEGRRARHAQRKLAGVRVVEGLTIGSVTGIVIATLAFFAANRLLPADAALGGANRAALEMWVFYLTWLVTFAHAWLRPAGAWRAQALAIAALAVACVLLDAATTGGRMLHPAAAGMDALLLALAALAGWTARRLAGQPVRERTLAPALERQA
jgi:hypothetical protein